MDDELLPDDEVAIKAALGIDVNTAWKMVKEADDCILAIDIQAIPDPNTPESIPMVYFGAPLLAFPSIGFAACWINDTIYYRKLRDSEKTLPESAVVIIGYDEWMAKMGFWFREFLNTIYRAPWNRQEVSRVTLPRARVMEAMEIAEEDGALPTTFLSIPVEYSDTEAATAVFSDGQIYSVHPE